MPDELIMRGKSASGTTETLNFGGRTPGYAYNLIDFKIYPTILDDQTSELSGTVTANDTSMSPVNPDFSDPGLIGTAIFFQSKDGPTNSNVDNIINDLFYITQDLLLRIEDMKVGAPMDINWQLKFKKVKLSSSAEAVANFNQFTIYDG